MGRITAWRRRSWPRKRRIRAPYRIFRPSGTPWFPIREDHFALRLAGIQSVEYPSWAVPNTIDRIDPYAV